MLGGLHAEVVSRVRHGVSIHNAELFERGLFSISAAEASAMDLQQRQLLERGYAALHDAGASQASRLGAIVGVAHVRRAGRWVRSGRGDRRVRLPTERGAAAVRMVGSAIRQDGRSTSLLMAPTSGQAQQGMLSAAPADAQLAWQDTAVLEAHGTDTALGDPIEVGAVAAVFLSQGERDRLLTAGSVLAPTARATPIGCRRL